MHKFESIEKRLKNGKLVVIRQAKISDAEALLNTIKTYVPQSEYIPKLGEEIKLTVSQTEDWINTFLKYDNSLLLVVEYENKLIGNIDLTGNRRKLMEHTAVIGMGILLEWRSSGLGTELMSAIIKWAKESSVLELIWLQVYTQNKIGVSLYKKMGFTENGIINDFFKQDSQYYDNLTMTLKVK